MKSQHEPRKLELHQETLRNLSGEKTQGNLSHLVSGCPPCPTRQATCTC